MKQVITALILLMTNIAVSQTWSQVGSGSPNMVRALKTHSTNLYTGDQIGWVCSWNGSTLTPIGNQFGVGTYPTATGGMAVQNTGMCTTGPLLYSLGNGANSVHQYSPWGPTGMSALAGYTPTDIEHYSGNVYLIGTGGTPPYQHLRQKSGTSWIAAPGSPSCSSSAGLPRLSTPGDGYTYMLGRFQIGANYYPVIQYDGITYSTLGVGTSTTQGYDAKIYNGVLYYSGSNGISRWNGTSWVPVYTGSAVSDMELYGSDLYFLHNTGIVIKYNDISNDTTLVATFSPSGSGAFDMEVYNGFLYVAGSFTAVNGVPAQNLAMLSVNYPTASFTAANVCVGSSVNPFNTSANATSYSWTATGASPATSNLMSPSFSYSTAGTYTIQLVASNVNGSSTYTQTVTVNPLPTASVTPAGPTTFCQGNSVLLQSSSATSYTWAPGGQTTQNITVSTSGSYSVTVTNSFGCSATSPATSVTVNPSPTPTVAQVGSDLTTGTYSSYQWLYNGATIPSATSQTYSPASNGNYQVIVTNGFGCSDTSAVFNWISTGIDSYSKHQQAFYVYPIPSTGSLNISVSAKSDLIFTNSMGQQVLSIVTDPGVHAINTDLVPGFYFLTIRSEYGLITKRIIIE